MGVSWNHLLIPPRPPEGPRAKEVSLVSSGLRLHSAWVIHKQDLGCFMACSPCPCLPGPGNPSLLVHSIAAPGCKSQGPRLWSLSARPHKDGSLGLGGPCPWFLREWEGALSPQTTSPVSGISWKDVDPGGGLGGWVKEMRKLQVGGVTAHFHPF